VAALEPVTAAPEFVLELALDPEVAPRLLRHPALGPGRQGRVRTQAEESIWLDTASGALARDGLLLEAPRRGPRRLVTTLPPADAPWQPGTPAVTVDDADALRRAEAEPIIPIAAFSGRRSTVRLAGDPAPIEVTVLTGKLRAVAAEAPTARLFLAGPADAVLELAATLARDLPLELPTAALGEAGRALARGEAPRLRRAGPPALGDAATVEAALEVAVGHLVEVMVQQAPLCRLDAGPTGVHQLRVALRRLRSVLQVFRPAARCPAVAAFDEGLKTLAKRLGPARDFDVFTAGLGAALTAALPEDKRIAALARAAEARRVAAYTALRQALDGAEFRRLTLDGVALLVRRPWRDAAAGLEAQQDALAEPLDAFGSRLLDKRWHKLREGGEDIRERSDEALHALRLEAKRLRYGAELFAPLWAGKASRRFLRRLAGLQEALGVANDVAVARALVAGLNGVPAWAVGAAEGFAIARTVGVRKKALAAWSEIETAKPFWPAP